MKKTVIALLVYAVVTASPSFAGEGSGDLKLLIIGFKSDKGKAIISVGNSKESYQSKKGKPLFARVSGLIENGEIGYLFQGIPHGEYAIRVIHDENDNGRLDYYFFGMPKEDYGFSGSDGERSGPPDYEKDKFIFNSDRMTIRIKMN
ncbi:MAG: DUF2141 domain-containing protein [Nitrospinota bacterium]